MLSRICIGFIRNDVHQQIFTLDVARLNKQRRAKIRKKLSQIIEFICDSGIDFANEAQRI